MRLIASLIRYGAENIALDADDETFRKFEASDIDSLLAASSSTKLLASSGEASTFSKV